VKSPPVWLAIAALALSAQADEVRQIAPDRFTPMYRDPNAMQPHKPAPTPAPPAADATPPARSKVAAPSRAQPLGACERAARDWLICLAATANLADAGVDEEERAILAGLSGRAGLNPLMAEAVTNALKAAEDSWRTLRERECGNLAIIERAYSGTLYETKLVCRIRRDIERVEALRERYAAAP
jgi:hypothetical protein